MNNTTPRTALAASNKRAAEARFGRYATRYAVGMWSKPAAGCCSEPVDGLPFNDLFDAARYVEAVRASGDYASVCLYDRVEGRAVTQGDVRRATEACDLVAVAS